MSLERTLRFLEDRFTVYFAGMDGNSLPFSEGKRLVRKTSPDQLTYLKALALVSDYIVVPPSFYFLWTNAHRNPDLLRQLTELYDASIIISPIYSSMNVGTDFLEEKLSCASAPERVLMQEIRRLLAPFFRHIPVLHRDVVKQSAGYRNLFMDELSSLHISSPTKRSVRRIVRSPQYDEVLLSRERLQNHLRRRLNAGKMNRRDFRRCFYATNRAYYQQGACTYDAVVSLVRAERYSVLKQSAFSTRSGILLAYDPTVLLGILAGVGIPRAVIERLSADDIKAIKSASIFPVFRDAYLHFATTLQEVILRNQRVSQRVLSESKGQLQEQAISRIIREGKVYSAKKRWWNIGEMSAFALGLGAVGFAVTPLFGAILGAVPILTYSLDLTPRLSDYVISQIAARELPFYIFVQELRAVVEQMDVEMSEYEA